MTLDPNMARFAGGRFRFVSAPGVWQVVDVEEETADGWVYGIIVERGENDDKPVWINLDNVLKAVDEGAGGIS